MIRRGMDHLRSDSQSSWRYSPRGHIAVRVGVTNGRNRRSIVIYYTRLLRRAIVVIVDLRAVILR